MKGIKKLYAEKNQHLAKKAVFENQGSHSPDVSPIRNKPPPLSRLVSLHTIADSDHGGIEDWPKNMFKAVTGRFGRMPRGGWNFITTYYCKKFSTSVTELSFKKKAKEKKNFCKNFSEKDSSASKRLKVGESNSLDLSLRSNNLFVKIKELFNCKVKELSDINIEDFERTSKIPSEKVDAEILSFLNLALGDYIRKYPPENMTQVARYLQASQFCYKELRFTSRPRSPWMSNIQAKVEDAKTSMEIL